MKIHFMVIIILFASLSPFTEGAKTIDPYKVLGVERNASQREIQKAFHKLSLQYHPDKNKNKGAQEKFAEINNAYEILSDEEKRKNYDLYGDEKGSPGFGGGDPTDHGGYTYFRSGGHGGQGSSRFTFRPDEWQNMGGQSNSKSFSFSFGNPNSHSSFGFGSFGLNDIFSNLFGGDSGAHFGGFGSSGGSQSGSRTSPKSIRAVNSQVFNKEITDRGMTWLLLSHSPTSTGSQYYESIISQVASSLEGALKVGSINCETEQSFCKDLGIYPRGSPRVFVYSYRAGGSGSLVEYTGDLDAKSLKTFCQDHLPRYSKRVDLHRFDFSTAYDERLPTVMLLSAKKDTPVIWRALSGLYRKRFIFYDVEVRDTSDFKVRELGVDALPAVIGLLSDGEKRILRTGIVKDLKSGIEDLSNLLDSFEKKNMKVASSRAKRKEGESQSNRVPLISGSNFDSLCGESIPVCIIGIFKSYKSREKLESILSTVSQKSLSRQQARGSGHSISYTLLDGTKHPAFLNSFDRYGFKSLDSLLVAYKPRKAKYAAFTGEMTAEEIERFISSVLNGDVQFNKTRQKPTFK